MYDLSRDGCCLLNLDTAVLGRIHPVKHLIRIRASVWGLSLEDLHTFRITIEAVVFLGRRESYDLEACHQE